MVTKKWRKFWTENGRYTDHTTAAWELFNKFCPINVQQCTRPSGEILQIVYDAWVSADKLNRTAANFNSFVLYGVDAFSGRARARLTVDRDLQAQVNDYRRSFNLLPVYN